MHQYLYLLSDVLIDGKEKADRTHTGTLSVFGRSMRFDLTKGFPLVTTKKVHFKGIVAELLWFLEGSTNSNRLQELGARIWDEWADEAGELGPIYGKQWTGWEDTKVVPATLKESYEQLGYVTVKELYDDAGLAYLVLHREINQITQAVELLKNNPDSRRILVSAWNPTVLPDESLSPQRNVELGQAALPACHTFFQLYTESLTLKERLDIAVEKGFTIDVSVATRDSAIEALDLIGVPTRKLSCSFYCRSQDLFLGTVYNIASYALLTHLLAHVTNMALGHLIWTGGDCHIYKNHIDQVKQQLKRKPLELPTLTLNPDVRCLYSFTQEDIQLNGYNHHPAIKAPVAI